MSGAGEGKIARVADQRREVAEQIAADMERFGGSWTKPWVASGAPMNAVSERAYRGGNRLHLAVLARKRGYDDPRWATFEQAKKLGWKLRKGEKSAVVEKWKEYSITKEEDAEVDAEQPRNEVRKFLRLVGYWSVFNAEQFENVEPFEPSYRQVDRRDSDELADGFIGSSRCDVLELEGDEAFYAPQGDYIKMPMRAQFSTTDAFLRVLWHEMSHSTANSDSPARRQLEGRFGSKEYAFEELVAELSSAFTAEAMGCPGALDIESEHYQQHLAYLSSWMAALRDDPDQLFKAAALAEKSSCYLVERFEEANVLEHGPSHEPTSRRAERVSVAGERTGGPTTPTSDAREGREAARGSRAADEKTARAQGLGAMR